MLKKTKCSGSGKSLKDMYKFGCLCIHAYKELERVPFHMSDLWAWTNGKHRCFYSFNGLSIIQCVSALKFCLASWSTSLDVSNKVQNPEMQYLMMESLLHLRPAFNLKYFM